MGDSQELVLQEGLLVEQKLILANIVKLRVSTLQLFAVLQVVNIVVEDGFGEASTLREYQVIELDVPVIGRELHCGEPIIEGVVELGQGEDHVLVEVV